MSPWGTWLYLQSHLQMLRQQSRGRCALKMDDQHTSGSSPVLYGMQLQRPRPPAPAHVVATHRLIKDTQHCLVHVPLLPTQLPGQCVACGTVELQQTL